MMKKQNKKMRSAGAIGACTLFLLMVLSYFRQPWIRVVVLLATILFIAVLLGRKSRLAKKIKRRMELGKRQEEAERQMETLRRNKDTSRVIDIPLDEDLFTRRAMMRHLCRRVTETLQRSYPEAKWKETAPLVLEDLLSGSPFRIQIFGAEEWNYAEAEFDDMAAIHMQLMKITELQPQKPLLQQPASLQPDQLKSVDWFEAYGQKKIMEACNDAAVRGLSELLVDRNGKLTALVHGEVLDLGSFSQFPSESCWGELKAMLEVDEVDAEILPGCFKIII